MLLVGAAKRPVRDQAGQVAWRGSKPARTWEGATLRLYVSTWANARPHAEVKTVELVSDLTGAVPFVIAITVE